MTEDRTAETEPVAERRSHVVSVKLSPREHNAVRAAATAYGMAPAEFIRTMATLQLSAQDIGERLRVRQQQLGDAPLTNVDALELWRFGGMLNDVLKDVQVSQEVLRTVEALLAPVYTTIKHIMQERGLIPSGEPKAAEGNT
jgi:hypothetical protein